MSVSVCVCVCVCVSVSVCCGFSHFRERVMTVSISFVPETAYAQGEQLHVSMCNIVVSC